MPIFSNTVAAVLSGITVRRERLVRFTFKSETMQLWEGGTGTLRTLDGQEWHGTGTLGQIGDVEQATGGEAPTVDFTLSGIDPSIVAKAKQASSEVKNRPVSIYVQHYDENWSPLDGVFETFFGAMDTIKLSGPIGSPTRTATLTAETLWTRRGFAPFSFISDRDQKRLHPGDRGCEQVASMTSKTIKWPQY
jgi:hypothetical protein